MVREGRMNADYQENTSRALWLEEWVGGKAEMTREEILPEEQRKE